MNIQKVLEFQNEFFRRLSRHEQPSNHVVPSLLSKVTECDDELVKLVLGQFGEKLRSFSQNIDFQHPEIATIFNGIICNDHDFAQECMQLLNSGPKEFNVAPIPKNKIDIPSSNRMPVRLLKDDKEREEIRLSKRMQIIDLYPIYKKGEETWHTQPDSFTKFLRFDKAYEEDFKVAEKKAIRYEELGCITLANEIRKSIEIFREHLDQSYYGFNRITMTNAAIILAKSLGYTYTEPTETRYSSWKITCKITIDRKFFGKYNFDSEQPIEFNSAASYAAGTPIFSQKFQDPYNYEPRVYPLHEFSEIATENIQNAISLLEKFPDANNKPIFDHFGVIVPGVAFPIERNGLYSFADERSMIQSHASRDDALKALDTILIKGNYFHPIVIGEKDGKCFFICYWS